MTHMYSLSIAELKDQVPTFTQSCEVSVQVNICSQTSFYFYVKGYEIDKQMFNYVIFSCFSVCILLKATKHNQFLPWIQGLLVMFGTFLKSTLITLLNSFPSRTFFMVCLDARRLCLFPYQLRADFSTLSFQWTIISFLEQ